MVEAQTEENEEQKKLDEILKRLDWIKRRMNHERVLQIFLQISLFGFAIGFSYIFIALTLNYTLPKESASKVTSPFFIYAVISLILSGVVFFRWRQLFLKFAKEELGPDSDNDSVGEVGGVDEGDGHVATGDHVGGDSVGQVK